MNTAKALTVMEEKIQQAEDEELVSKRKKEKVAAVSTCYSCRYFDSSLPSSCSHYCNYRVQWDSIRQFTYRIPSPEMTTEHRGVCPYFIPDPVRSVLFMAEEERDRNLLIEIGREAKKKKLDLVILLEEMYAMPPPELDEELELE